METDMPTDYAALGKEIGELVQAKNEAYGNSFANSGWILAILYPNGVTVEQYSDMLTVVRILDKLARIATRKDAFGESPFRDIAGYGLLGYAKDLDVTPPPDVPLCLTCGINVIPAHRTMYCGDECMMKMYPGMEADSDRWHEGEGRHNNK
jgi:hypothetical protein